MLQSQHRYMHQSLQHRDDGCQYHHLKQAVLQPEIPGISSKHPRPCCSSPNTTGWGVSEGVRKRVNFHVAQGNLDVFLEETQQKVVTPAVSVLYSNLEAVSCPQIPK